MDVTADYLALRRDVGAVELPRDVVYASGPDTETFLQGQLSQDVAALAVGASAPSLLLSAAGEAGGLAAGQPARARGHGPGHRRGLGRRDRRTAAALQAAHPL